MLIATIEHAGVSQQYTDQLVEFSWETTNNEGASFSASVPNLTASFTIADSDAFIASLLRGDTAEIESTESDGLVLKLTIIEVVPLNNSGKTEISCTGNFFSQTNDVWGVIDISGSWAEIQDAYSLEMVECHDSAEISAQINVQKKQDIAMGVAWAYSTRRNVSRTPFTSGDNYFQNDGVGLFKNIKPTESDAYAPVYRVNADGIIGYDVSPAQPPVTHLQTTSLGQLAPDPDIPKISVVVGEENKNLISAYIEELDLAATIVKPYEGSSVLRGSDQIESLVNISDIRDFAGMFSNAYVLVTGDSSISVIDRVTGDTLYTNSSVYGIRAAIRAGGKMAVRLTNRIYPMQEVDADYETVNYNNVVPAQVLWFAKSTTSPAVGLIWWEGTQQYKVITGGPYGFYFVSASKVATAAERQSGKYSLAGLFVSTNTPTPNSGYTTYFACITTQSVGTVSIERRGVQAVTPSWEDYVDESGETFRAQSSVILDALMVADTEWGQTEILHRVKYVGLTTGAIQYVVQDIESGGSRPVHKVYIDTKGIDRDETKYIEFFGGTPETPEEWMYEASGAYAATVAWPSGSVSKWVRYGDAFDTYKVIMFRRFLTVYSYPEYSEKLEYFSQIDEIPFMTREIKLEDISLKIAEGSTNPVSLPFKVGVIEQRDRALWDTEAGRIEVDVAWFDVRKNSDGTWIEKNVQALNVMAIASYAQVYLDPDKPTEYVLVKVTGFSLSYTGVVRAKMTGIIVR